MYGTQPRVLVVDDNRITLRLAASYLSQLDVQAITFRMKTAGLERDHPTRRGWNDI